MKPVELGHNAELSMGGDATPTQAPKPPKVFHPSVHIELDEEMLKALGSLPESGTMTVEYCVVRKDVRNEHEGKKSGSIDIDIMKIISAKANREDSPEEALDKLAQSVYKE